VVVGGQTSFIISLSPTSKHQMSKRACPTEIPKAHKRMCARLAELSALQDAISYGRTGYADSALFLADLTERGYRDVHKKQWSRIKPTFGIGEDEHGAEEFNVEIGVYDGYRLCEEKKHTFKMADWAVHTNYPRNPRNPFDFEDFKQIIHT
jgi:hypothetical protein